MNIAVSAPRFFNNLKLRHATTSETGYLIHSNAVKIKVTKTSKPAFIDHTCPTKTNKDADYGAIDDIQRTENAYFLKLQSFAIVLNLSRSQKQQFGN